MASQDPLWGLLLPIHTREPSMKYSGLEKLIFLSSTVWLLHWGVRLTQVSINALY